MSSNHKAPLAAFVVVAIACVVVVATNSMRSYARDAWRSFADPVVSGLALIPSEHHESTKVVVAKTADTLDEAVVPAGPSLVPVRQHRRGAHTVRHTATAAAATEPVSATAVPTTPPSQPKPTAPSVPSHGTFGVHGGWSQGQHNGWSHAPHGGQAASAYSGATGNGHGWGATGAQHGKSSAHSAPNAKATHGPSWKSAKTYASSSFSAGQGAEPAAEVGSSHGNAGHGNGNGNGNAGHANNGRGH